MTSRCCCVPSRGGGVLFDVARRRCAAVRFSSDAILAPRSAPDAAERAAPTTTTRSRSDRSSSPSAMPPFCGPRTTERAAGSHGGTSSLVAPAGRRRRSGGRIGRIEGARGAGGTAGATSRREAAAATTTMTTTTRRRSHDRRRRPSEDDRTIPPLRDPKCSSHRRLADRGEESVRTLVLLRHGESEWNALNKFTGWCDVNLTERGKDEARSAGRLLRENGIELDKAYTSVLKRASYTTNATLDAADQHWVSVSKSWRLNERHYGALQGYDKDTAYEELELDQELVMEMRRSYDVRPPTMDDDHEHWHGKDRRYRNLSEEQLERTRSESLKDTADRIMPFFDSAILPSLKAGNKCLVVSHANTIRTLIKHIDGISDEDIKGMSIPTGIPLLYRLDRDFKPVDPKSELEFRYRVEPKGYTWATSRERGFRGVYLGDLERLKEIQRKRDATHRDWQRIVFWNIVKSLDERGTDLGRGFGNGVVETRQLWWRIHEKMQHKEFGNMLLLAKMKDYLEEQLFQRKRRYLTLMTCESVMKKIHFDAEGKIVEPFVNLKEKKDREKRQWEWYRNLALDLEEEEEEDDDDEEHPMR